MQIPPSSIIIAPLIRVPVLLVLVLVEIVAAADLVAAAVVLVQALVAAPAAVAPVLAVGEVAHDEYTFQEARRDSLPLGSDYLWIVGMAELSDCE